MVFQNYALFPHADGRRKPGLPAENPQTAAAEVDAKGQARAGMVKLDKFANRYPGQMSGGQQQRVALARRWCFEPQLVLMDEPLGALDKQLREHMQLEIKHIHENLGVTVVYVTRPIGADHV